jgi:hypothetical protein
VHSDDVFLIISRLGVIVGVPFIKLFLFSSTGFASTDATGVFTIACRRKTVDRVSFVTTFAFVFDVFSFDVFSCFVGLSSDFCVCIFGEVNCVGLVVVSVSKPSSIVDE